MSGELYGDEKINNIYILEMDILSNSSYKDLCVPRGAF